MKEEIKRRKLTDDCGNGDRRFMQSTLFTSYGNFFVSTAWRDDIGVFETFAWKLDEYGEKDGLCGDATRGSANRRVAIEQHHELSESLMKTGAYEYNIDRDVKENQDYLRGFAEATDFHQIPIDDLEVIEHCLIQKVGSLDTSKGRKYQTRVKKVLRNIQNKLKDYNNE